MHHRLIRLVALAVALGLSWLPAAVSAAGYETPTAPPASAILPPSMLSGPNYVVDPVVGTDGYLDRKSVV